MTDSVPTPMGFFDGMPGWAKAIIFGLCIIPVTVALSGMFLNINVGEHIDAYMEILLEQQRSSSEADSAVLGAIADQLADMEARLMVRIDSDETRIFALESDVEQMKEWACGPVFHDGNPVNDPEFCE